MNLLTFLPLLETIVVLPPLIAGCLSGRESLDARVIRKAKKRAFRIIGRQGVERYDCSGMIPFSLPSAESPQQIRPEKTT
jgi:hypothetical protein